MPADTQRLLAHAQLPPQDGEVLGNLELLGAHVQRALKDPRAAPQPLFAKKQRAAPAGEEYALSRHQPFMKSMLEEHMTGMLDQMVFPYTKPQLDAPTNGMTGQDQISQASLRSAKPTWAKSRLASVEPRQRIIVFMAGGATYSEARACYDVSRSSSRDVVLATSHMITPGLFLRQVGDLGVDRRRLDLPMDRQKPKAPAHLFEPEPKPKPKPPPTTAMPPPTAMAAPPSRTPAMPTAAMHSMSLNPSSEQNGSNGLTSPPMSTSPAPPQSGGGKLSKKDKDKDKDKDKEKDEKKKKHHFFSRK